MIQRRASTSDASSITFGDSSLRRHGLSPASMRVTGVNGLDMSSSSASAIEGSSAPQTDSGHRPRCDQRLGAATRRPENHDTPSLSRHHESGVYTLDSAAHGIARSVAQE